MRVELHFHAGEGALVRSLPAARAGRVEFLGMRLDDGAKGWVKADEPTRIVLDGDHAVSDAAALRKDVKAGHIVPADKATADFFGVPWREAGPAAAEPQKAPPGPAAGPADQAPADPFGPSGETRRKVPR